MDGRKTKTPGPNACGPGFLAKPTWEERRQRFHDLRERLNAASGDDRNLRTALAQEICGIVGEVRLGRHEISYVRRKAVVFAGKSRMPAPTSAFNDHPEYVSDMERYHVALEEERELEQSMPQRRSQRAGPRS